MLFQMARVALEACYQDHALVGSVYHIVLHSPRRSTCMTADSIFQFVSLTYSMNLAHILWLIIEQYVVVKHYMYKSNTLWFLDRNHTQSY
jgi:hypothetical protein